MNIREWTLPIYTILTQLSIGALFVLWVIRTLARKKIAENSIDHYFKIPVLILFTTIVFAILFAHYHLSRPFMSFLALRNIQSSWLSRELLANFLYVTCVGLLLFYLWFKEGHYKFKTVLGWVAIFFGFATDYCMAKIYQLPSQPAWNSPVTPISFLTTTFLLGVVTIPVLFMMDFIFKGSQEQEDHDVHAKLIKKSLGQLAIIGITLGILMAGINVYQITTLFSGNAATQTSLNLLLDIYQPLLIMRLVLLFAGTGWLVFLAIQLNQKKMLVENLLSKVFIACLLVMIAEILGRYLFYAIHVRIGI